MWLINKIGSIRFTIVISVLLIVLLITSTSVESLYGTTFVQNTFYQTRWFDLFLSLLWLNILCSMMRRFPFKRAQIGYVFTHIGVMGFLLGALMTRIGGVEGQLALYEGSQANQIRTGGYELLIKAPGGKEEVIALRQGSNVVNLPSPGQSKDVKLDIEFLLNATDEVRLVPAAGFTGNRGIKLEVESKDLDLQKEFWLTDRHPMEPHPGMVFVGPLRFVLGKDEVVVKKDKTPRLHVQTSEGDVVLTVDLSVEIPTEINLGEGRTIRNIQYYTHARVAGGKIVNHPDAGDMNPAIEFDLSDAQGQTTHILKFALFPDFASMHGKPGEALETLSFQLDVPMADHIEEGSGMMVKVYPREKAAQFDVTLPDGQEWQRTMPLNQWVDSDWMGTRFRVVEVLKDVDFTSEVVNSSTPNAGSPAVKVKLYDGTEVESQWLTEGPQMGYKLATEELSFRLRAAKQKLPFSLTLEDFRKHDYPGTNQAAAYESDVTLTDDNVGLVKGAMISMNNPLDYKGYRIFQSSYAQNETSGEASIFTVSKNPGIPFIYLSSCFICGGTLYQFYGRKMGRGRKQEKSTRAT